MASALVDAVGASGAVLTTVCWVPQAVKIIRDRDTRAIGGLASHSFISAGHWENTLAMVKPGDFVLIQDVIEFKQFFFPVNNEPGKHPKRSQRKCIK